MNKILLAAPCLLLLILANPCLAEEQSSEELCRTRNLASCEINGLKFFIDDDCPKGAKILRPHGKERCDGLNEKIISEKINPTEVVARQAVPFSETEVVTQKTEGGLFGNPLLLVAVLGVLQGLISRAGLGILFIVAIVIPTAITWGVVSGMHLHAEGVEYFAAIATEFIKILACSLLGWGTGLVMHVATLRLLSR